MPITTIIFDVDDTLYDVGSGFTAHRNGYGAESFMVGHLKFASMEEAKIVRDEYFAVYHSTAKALTVAQAEGRLPPDAPKFDAKIWPTGGPRNWIFLSWEYVKRVLKELGVWEYFGDDRLFAVDDTLPHCKPEREAFELIFERIGVKADECVMVEDSMKNIRKAKELGMKTVLVVGRPSEATTASETTKSGDKPIETDPAVDVAIEVIHKMRDSLPSLWASSPAEFTS
ncbi:nucleotidase [Fragilaria crotonensis]|nr:nucleotidase [Fragilaria crotonensis]